MRYIHMQYLERHVLSVSEHRHDQALGTSYRHTDVGVVLVDDLIGLVVDDSVDGGNLLQCRGTCLDEGGHEAETAAVLLLELILVCLSHLHQITHVTLLECC